MKRLRYTVASVLLGSIVAGCSGGGPEIGPPAEIKGAQTNEFKEAMEKANKKMTSKGKPAGAAAKEAGTAAP
jgi:hypothetical protein